MDNDTRPDSADGLGQFLRARRERLSPADAGLPSVGRRRVPGLGPAAGAARARVSRGYQTPNVQGP
ncbi:transcriptional regulator, partial [Streptomyces sp. NPDC055036]